jgi:hypothetical protein
VKTENGGHCGGKYKWLNDEALAAYIENKILKER